MHLCSFLAWGEGGMKKVRFCLMFEVNKHNYPPLHSSAASNTHFLPLISPFPQDRTSSLHPSFILSTITPSLSTFLLFFFPVFNCSSLPLAFHSSSCASLFAPHSFRIFFSPLHLCRTRLNRFWSWTSPSVPIQFWSRFGPDGPDV